MHRFTQTLFPLLLMLLLISGCVPVSMPAAEPLASPDASATAATGAASTQAALSANSQECVDSYDPDVDYFPDKATVTQAQLFQVDYHAHYKVVRTQAKGDYFAPIDASDLYVLLQCGAPAPELTGALADALVIEVPVQTVSVANNEEVAALLELGVANRIVTLGTPNDSSQAWHPRIKELIDDGIPVTGTSFNINLETVVAADPDLLILLAWIGNQQENILRARDLGIATVGHHTWLEPTPLGRAEWLKFFALFFNQEAVANNIYTEIKQNYRTLETAARAQAEQPTAFFADIGSTVAASQNDFLARLLEDAGAQNVLADPAASAHPTTISLETLVSQTSDAEFWFTGRSDVRETAPAESFKALTLDQVYSNDKAEPLSGHSYFGDAVFRVDRLLIDFVVILHPTLVPDGYEPIYLQPILRLD